MKYSVLIILSALIFFSCKKRNSSSESKFNIAFDVPVGSESIDYGSDLMFNESGIVCFGRILDEVSNTYIAQLDSNGTKIKDLILTVPGNQNPFKVIKNESQYLIFGNYSDASERGYYIQSISKSIEEQSYIQYSDTNSQRYRDVIYANGKYLLVGKYLDDFSITVLDEHLNRDTMISIPLDGLEEGVSIVPNSDGYLALGYTYSFSGNRDNYLVQYNSNYDTLWTKAISRGVYDEPHNFLSINDNEYYIVGHSDKKDIDHNMSVLHVDNLGNVLSEFDFGGELHDGAQDMMVVDTLQYILGRTNSFGSGNEDVLLLAKGPSGVCDSIFIGGGLSDTPVRMKKLGDALYIIGSTNSKGAGQYDMYVAKVALN